MTLEEFITKQDFDGAVVLLEGKRLVREEDQPKLYQLGRLLASQTQKMLFRSGNADGSDQFFSDGVCSVDPTRLQVITPYSGHRKKHNKAYHTINLDDVNVANEPEVLYQSKSNKTMGKLIDQFISGEKNRNSIKAAYILRDTIKAIGTDKIAPATFGLFYDDLENPLSGGTGHTMKVCLENAIPIANQEIWMRWLV